MRLLTPVLIALGLAFSAPVIAQEAPAAVTASAPDATAATPAVAAPAELKPVANVGQPIDRGYTLQPQVTKNGQFAMWMHDVILMPIITAISLFVLGLVGAYGSHKRVGRPFAVFALAALLLPLLLMLRVGNNSLTAEGEIFNYWGLMVLPLALALWPAWLLLLWRGRDDNL